MRLDGRTAIVVGGGQSPGEGVGNGRATALTFAREGAAVMVLDNRLRSAEETAAMITDAGGKARAREADVTREASLKAAVEATVGAWGRLDILHYNVGVSIAGGDAPPSEITEEAFDRCVAINLRGSVMAAKHALPVMREQGSGVLLFIASMAAWLTYPLVGYKTTKAAMIAQTEQLAAENARHGVRANVILPGLMDTPMAVDTRAREFGKPREEIAAARDARVPLGGKMGTGWDVANAALFLASDEARFITGVTLPVDGGAAVVRGGG